jgi:hypothetical protein
MTEYRNGRRDHSHRATNSHIWRQPPIQIGQNQLALMCHPPPIPLSAGHHLIPLGNRVDRLTLNQHLRHDPSLQIRRPIPLIVHPLQHPCQKRACRSQTDTPTLENLLIADHALCRRCGVETPITHFLRLAPRIVKTNGNTIIIGRVHRNLVTQPAFP